MRDIKQDSGVNNGELKVNPDGVVDGQYNIRHELSDDDLVAELANLPTRAAERESAGSGIGRIRKTRQQRVRTAHRFMPTALEETSLGIRWVRLVLLFVISLAILISLFQYDQHSREAGVKQNMAALLGVPSAEMYRNLVDEAFFWECQPDTLNLGVNPAPASVKASHRAYASIMCITKAFGMTFWQIVEAHKDIELPLSALKRSFTYDKKLERLRSNDGGAPMFIPPYPKPAPAPQAANPEAPADAAGKPGEAAPKTDGATGNPPPQAGGTLPQAGNPNTGVAGENSGSVPTSPKGD